MDRHRPVIHRRIKEGPRIDNAIEQGDIEADAGPRFQHADHTGFTGPVEVDSIAVSTIDHRYDHGPTLLDKCDLRNQSGI